MSDHGPSSLPRVAHFVFGLWDLGPPPVLFQETMTRWRAQGWHVKLWNLEAVDALLATEPRLEHICRSFRRRVQVADLARYLIVEREGGFYFDGDCLPGPRSLVDEVAEDGEASAFFFIEKVQPAHWPAESVRLYPIRQQIPEHRERLANYALGATAGHPLLRDILALAMARSERELGRETDYDILYKTGPDCVTDAVQPARGRYPEVRVLDHALFMRHVMAGGWRDDKDAVGSAL